MIRRMQVVVADQEAADREDRRGPRRLRDVNPREARRDGDEAVALELVELEREVVERIGVVAAEPVPCLRAASPELALARDSLEFARVGAEAEVAAGDVDRLAG